MKGKRTGIDFSKHELVIKQNNHVRIFQLKQPDTIVNNIKFINCEGIMTVTGDFGNWVFCRQFIPGGDDSSLGYWLEKLQISSCQEPEKYDSEKTMNSINEMLKNEDLDEQEKEYLEECLSRVDDELDYTSYAFREMPYNWDYEMVPFEKKVNRWFIIILDGFDEINRRVKENQKLIEF